MSNWFPEIMYEEDNNGQASKIPFIAVPENEEMPKMLFIFENRATGEFEPGQNGEELPVVTLDLRQYANMDILKKNLLPDDYDKVRKALGLENLSTATKKGRSITSNIREKLS